MSTKYSVMDDCNWRLRRAYQVIDWRFTAKEKEGGGAVSSAPYSGGTTSVAHPASAVPVQQNPVALRGAVPNEWNRLATPGRWSAYSHTMGAPCVRACLLLAGSRF
jgi:hypothetical protein